MNKYRKGLQFLAQAIASGLPGETAYGIFQDAQAQRNARMDERRQSMSSLMDLAVGLSQQGYSADQVARVVGGYAERLPGLGNRAERSLADFASALPPSPMGSGPESGAPADVPMMPDGTLAFDASDEETLKREVMMMEMSGQYPDLRTARMEIMDRVRATEVNGARYSPTTIAYIYYLIGTYWTDSDDPRKTAVYGQNNDPLDPPDAPDVNYGGLDGYTPRPANYGGLTPGIRPDTWGIR